MLAAIALIVLDTSPVALSAGANTKKEPSFKGKSLTEWTARAESKDAKTRIEAAQALRDMGLAAVTTLTEWLEDDDPTKRSTALNSLGCIGPGAKAAVPTLIHRLKTEKSVSLHTRTVDTLAGERHVAVETKHFRRRRG